MSAIKSLYIDTLRTARRGATAVGLLHLLEEHREKRPAIWLRSLFAIYDLEDMVHLDLPWWTFDAIEIVDRFLKRRSGASVFEYGSGASTLWLAKRASNVISIEHDPEWSQKMESYIRQFKNIELRTVTTPFSDDPIHRSQKTGWGNREFRPYVETIAGGGSYDLIIIDGRARSSCLNAALSHLRSGGLILFDDSYRKRYQQALLNCGLPRHDARGLSPGLPYSSTTTLFSNDASVLESILAR